MKPIISLYHQVFLFENRPVLSIKIPDVEITVKYRLVHKKLEISYDLIKIIITIIFLLISSTVLSQIEGNVVSKNKYNVSQKNISKLETSYGMDPYMKEYVDSLENILILCGLLAKDFEGNIYRTILLGDQIWMCENLKSTKYADGTQISGVFTYDDNEMNAKDYGRLYNWDAAMNSTGNYKSKYGHLQGVCPNGWHVPTNAEWTKLVNYMGAKEIAGGLLKEKGSKHWLTPNLCIAEENKFSALPAGSLGSDGYYTCILRVAYFWTSSSYSERSKCFRSLYYNSTEIHTSHINKSAAFSVRCVKD
ncbi:MAG: FISUMP domain-containing protein [Bacteroidota bacterium]